MYIKLVGGRLVESLAYTDMPDVNGNVLLIRELQEIFRRRRGMQSADCDRGGLLRWLVAQVNLGASCNVLLRSALCILLVAILAANVCTIDQDGCTARVRSGASLVLGAQYEEGDGAVPTLVRWAMDIARFSWCTIAFFYAREVAEWPIGGWGGCIHSLGVGVALFVVLNPGIWPTNISEKLVVRACILLGACTHGWTRGPMFWGPSVVMYAVAAQLAHWHLRPDAYTDDGSNMTTHANGTYTTGSGSGSHVSSSAEGQASGMAGLVNHGGT